MERCDTLAADTPIGRPIGGDLETAAGFHPQVLEDPGTTVRPSSIPVENISQYLRGLVLRHYQPLSLSQVCPRQCDASSDIPK